MTSQWSLAALFADFHDKVQCELATARKLGHPTDKGDASEQVWIDVLTHYLPRRYEARKGFVVDSRGVFSQQIDVIVHDRQYSPFVFTFKGTDVVPAETTEAIATGVAVGTLAFVVTGRRAEIAAGTPVTAYIERDTEILP